jgi:hypothetical protein
MGGIILDSTLGTEQDRTEGIPSGALANLNTPVLPGWILKIRASADIVREHHDPEKWTFSPEKKGGAVLATSKSNLGTYHLIAMPEALSLFLESSDKTYDLANLLQDEKIGPHSRRLQRSGWLAFRVSSLSSHSYLQRRHSPFQGSKIGNRGCGPLDRGVSTSRIR